MGVWCAVYLVPHHWCHPRRLGSTDCDHRVFLPARPFEGTDRTTIKNLGSYSRGLSCIFTSYSPASLGERSISTPMAAIPRAYQEEHVGANLSTAGPRLQEQQGPAWSLSHRSSRIPFRGTYQELSPAALPAGARSLIHLEPRLGKPGPKASQKCHFRQLLVNHRHGGYPDQHST